MKIKIEFESWCGKAAIEIEAGSIKEAVEKAVADGATLSHANLYRANLYRANLDGANLSHANLEGANLDGANLSHANLYRANLSHANLDGANLSHANLDGANLDGANLDGATLDGAKLWIKRPVLQLGQCGSRNGITIAYFFEDKSEPKVKCGCFWGTLTEFRKKIHETHAGTFFEKEYIILADHIESIYNLQKEETK